MKDRWHYRFPQCCWRTWKADSITGFPSAAEGHEGQIALQVSPVLLKDTDIRDVTSSFPLNCSHAVCTLHTHNTYNTHWHIHYLSLWWMSFVITLFGAVKPVTGSWVFSVLLSQIIMLTLVAEPPTHSLSWLENFIRLHFSLSHVTFIFINCFYGSTVNSCTWQICFLLDTRDVMCIVPFWKMTKQALCHIRPKSLIFRETSQWLQDTDPQDSFCLNSVLRIFCH